MPNNPPKTPAQGGETVPCHDCSGNGYYGESGNSKCAECNGTGGVPTPHQEPDTSEHKKWTDNAQKVCQYLVDHMEDLPADIAEILNRRWSDL